MALGLFTEGTEAERDDDRRAEVVIREVDTWILRADEDELAWLCALIDSALEEAGLG